MFVRKKKNKSGKISVQIISKTNGKYRVVKTVGCSGDPEKIKCLYRQAHHLLPEINRQGILDLRTETDKKVDIFVSTLANSQIRIIGPELVFGRLFDSIGFNAIKDELFRHIVITRLVYPTSKLKTVDYLYRYQGIDIDVDTVYRFLDKLNEKYKAQAERIAFEHTGKNLKNISVVFYDMTTLYFEAEDEDDFRKIGFSKDGKFQCPQIMLGLLVGENGLPIGYDIFEGNTFEGKTLLPVLEDIQKKYGFKKPIVVADAGLLSKDNIEKLQAKNYKFIIGGRIKNETEETKNQILAQAGSLNDGDGFKLVRPDGSKLIVTYSAKRAKKDKYNREKGLKRLRQKVKYGKLTKQHINNRGYNKLLAIKGKAEVMIDEEKIRADEKWDGLKGYVTNSRLSVDKVVKNYTQLWQIEKAFRISKTDLRIRPVYHFKRRRIEAHICIAFVAYTVYKELEKLLLKNKASFSPKRAIELTQNMYQISYILPDAGKKQTKLLKMDDEQQILFNIVKNN